MATIGSARTGLISSRTAREGADAAGGVLPSDFDITSEDETVTIVHSGNVWDLSVPGSRDIVLGQVSYGQGEQDVDDVVPVTEDGIKAYLGAAMNADVIGAPTDVLADSNRYEFAVPVALSGLGLRVFITRLSAGGESLCGVGGCITINGTRYNDLSWGLTFDGTASAENVVQLPTWLDVAVQAGDSVGVTVETFAEQASGNVQVTIEIVGQRATSGTLEPFAPAYMTIRQETAPSTEYPITVDGDDVTVFPNRQGVAALDSVIRVFAGPTLATDGGIDHLHFSGPQALFQRTPGPGALTTPPSAAALAPFHIFMVARANSEVFSSRAIMSTFPVTTPLQYAALIAPFPSWSFKLVWQYREDASSNIATVADISAQITAKWCLYEWKCDGSTLTFLLNGVVIATATNDPIGVMAAEEVTDNILGSTVGAGIDVDVRVRYVYKEALPEWGEAQTRAYLLATYPVTP